MIASSHQDMRSLGPLCRGIKFQIYLMVSICISSNPCKLCNCWQKNFNAPSVFPHNVQDSCLVVLLQASCYYFCLNHNPLHPLQFSYVPMHEVQIVYCAQSLENGGVFFLLHLTPNNIVKGIVSDDLNNFLHPPPHTKVEMRTVYPSLIGCIHCFKRHSSSWARNEEINYAWDLPLTHHWT